METHHTDHHEHSDKLEQAEHKNHKNGNHTHHNHDEHHEMMIRDFKTRFWVSFALTIPILLLSPMIQEFLGYSLEFMYSQYVLFFISGFVFIYGGWPFLTGLKEELSDRKPGMMTLIGIALSVAFVYSGATSFGLEGKTFFWELATLVVIMLLGHWVEMRSVLSARKSLKELVNLMPSEAHLIQDDQTKDVKVSELEPGNIVLVKPGEKVPADGKITKGESSLNESMISGESKPVKKSKGDKVIGGTINGEGSFQFEVTELGDEAYLSKVISMVQTASESKSKAQSRADRIAFWLTIVALTAGTTSFVYWMFAGESIAFSLERMVSVMVIACPHALGLAVPLVIAISTSISAKQGILIRNRTAFENLGKVTTIAFDKTGTLTYGNFKVEKFKSLAEKHKDEDVLEIAASAESDSEHLIAASIIEAAKENELKLSSPTDFEAIKGVGIRAKLKDSTVMVVSPDYLKKQDIRIPEEINLNSAKTTVFLLIDDELSGYITLSDEIRPSAKKAVRELQDKGIKVMMLTGDNEAVAKEVGKELGIDDVQASLMPDKKLEIVKELQKQGEYVAMTGDGVNDAPALAAADLGIAVGSGTDVAAETADIILVESDPNHIMRAFELGRATKRKTTQNFVWATAYNVVAIPLATGFFAGLGLIISPALGAILMSLSAVIVAFNAKLLGIKHS